MRNAETVLCVIRERGIQGKSLDDLYRQLFNPGLYLLAYAHLYPNKGAMTKGATEETVDGMSLAKIRALIDDLRWERFRWTPVRRTSIPKKNGKLRPLGIPTWTDKLLQEAMRLLLEAYYEPQFSPHSHGFRPGRGCHTALQTVNRTWTGTKWFIEGDVQGCFDNIDHEVLLTILAEQIHDNRFLRLLRALLAAGYLEKWTYHTTYSGTPQGGVISPILTNIYLHKLDTWVEQVLRPAYTRGKRRRSNDVYTRLKSAARSAKARHDESGRQALLKQARAYPACDPDDPHFRRLHYIRYADDFMLGFAGPRAEAEAIKEQLRVYLKDTLKLALSPEKTLITQATKPARFLGYDIVSQRADDRRAVNGKIALRVPTAVLRGKESQYKDKGEPARRPELLSESDFTIVQRYGVEYRGFVQYYVLAQNVSWLWHVHWVMRGSLLKTLANKHKSTMMVEERKLATRVDTPHGPIKCLEVRVERAGKNPLIARFGGLSLHQQKTVSLVDAMPSHARTERTELVTRLLADRCELCGSEEACQVHHIRKMADLHVRGQREKPLWVQQMASRRRKTLVVCRVCHLAIHAGRPTRQPA